MGKRLLDSDFYYLPSLTKSIALVLLGFGFSFNAIAVDVGCNNAFVQLLDDEMVIDVQPNLSNDTINLQCALDAATSMGVPTVRLRGATYSISSVVAENFKGTLEGKTKATTIVNVLDNSVDCVAINDSGMYAAALKFIKGEPRVRFMTIRAEASCTDGLGLDTILHFTGAATGTADCDNDVIFGAVDRVVLDGTSINNGPWAAVEAAPEGRFLGGCKETLLGTFKLNRSTIQNTFSGVVTNMKAGAQVDVNFNEFQNNIQAVNVWDSNQNTTITTNKFFGDNTLTNNYQGVYITNWSDNPPNTSRVVIHNNEFNISATTLDNFSYGVLQVFDFYDAPGNISNISTVITNNTFNLNGVDGGDIYGVRFKDSSNVHVSANRFTGHGARAIYVSGSTPMTGWTITANTGFATFTHSFLDDIRLGSNTSMFIVGPGQGLTVRDDGNNTVLPQ